MLISLATPAIADLVGDNKGGISIRIAEISSIEQNNPLAKLYFVDHMQPSQEMTRRIEVSNTTNSTQLVTIYSSAAENTKNGFIAADGRESSELTRWISVTPALIQLLPGGYATVSVTFTIPPNVRPGTRYGVIWAETTLSGDISTVNRVGIRIMIPIGEVKDVVLAKTNQLEKIRNWIKRNFYQTLVFAVLLTVNLAVLGTRMFSATVIGVRRRRVARKQRNAPTVQKEN
jgi:hypothetical protein